MKCKLCGQRYWNDLNPNTYELIRHLEKIHGDVMDQIFERYKRDILENFV